MTGSPIGPYTDEKEGIMANPRTPKKYSLIMTYTYQVVVRLATSSNDK